MAYREVTRKEFQEIIRRWQAGASTLQIAAGAGVARNTVRKYLTEAGQAHFSGSSTRSRRVRPLWLVMSTWHSTLSRIR